VNPTDPLAALADIELPAPPDWGPVIAFSALALVFIAAVSVRALLIWRRRSRRDTVPPVPPRLTDEAQTRLARLREEWDAGAIDARTAAYRLAVLLRLGLGLPQLRPAAPPRGMDAAEWRETLAVLQSLRYTPAPRAALTPEIFRRADRWLGQRVATAEGARDV
jgi:hypothetical protein